MIEAFNVFSVRIYTAYHRDFDCRRFVAATDPRRHWQDYWRRGGGSCVSVVKRAFPGAQVSRVGPKFNRTAKKGSRKAVDALNDDLTV
jgi:hypothetical protein